MAKPLISYPGSKWKFIKDGMLDYFPTDMKVFIEPFFGGGSVSLSVADDPRFTKLERMIGGDLYTEMWAFWTGVKTDPSAVEEIATKWFLERCPHQSEIHDTGFIGGEARKYLKGGEMENFEQSEILTEADKQNIRDKIALYELACQEGQNFWNWAETVDTTTMSIPERAARMMLVNKISFSGMGDAGSLSKDQFCEFTLDKLSGIADTSKLLQKIEIYNVSFEETMKYADENPQESFIFLDPPYCAQEGSGLYGKGGSTHRGFPHQHFAEFTKQMKCKWFMTYDDSVTVRKLFQGKTITGDLIYMKPYVTKYTMAGKTAEDALAGEELFISNVPLDKTDVLDDFNF
jgi:site-specific DNA-adenine methylase